MGENLKQWRKHLVALYALIQKMRYKLDQVPREFIINTPQNVDLFYY